MAAEELEKLVVKLEADVSSFSPTINKATDDAVKSLKKVEEAEQAGKKGANEWADVVSGKLMAAFTGLFALFSANAALNFFTNLIKGSVQASASFETFTVQFETLLGSAGAAKKRIDELAQFGQTTPFELPEIVEANRLLQTFGGTALATGENLRRIGDSAAAVNAPFKEVAFWTGRMYAAIQSGRPFGEASARLQELGILTGDVRTKLEDMQKAGADGTAIWAAYSEMIDSRFAGAMDRLSKTFQGVMSNIADFQGMLLREGGATLFEGLREDAIEFYDIINQPDVKEALVSLAEAFGNIADKLREAVTGPLLEGLQDLDAEKVERLAASFTEFGNALGKLASTDTRNINSIVDTLDGLAQSATTIIETVNALKEYSGVISGITPLKDVLGERDIVPFFLLTEGLGKLNEKIKEFTGSSLTEWVTGAEKVSEVTDPDFLYQYSGALEDTTQAMSDAADKAADAAKELEKLSEAAESGATSLIDLQADLAEKSEALEADHGEKIADIAADYEDKKADIIKDREQGLAELEKDTQKKRQDIAEQAAKDLAALEQEVADKREDINSKAQQDLEDLSRDTADAIAKERREQNNKEERAEEDHQRDMKRLRESYLDDLTDAVKSRDARAIVDLRRRFQRERRERNEDHRTEQRRGRGDTENRIEEIRLTERRRREEIQRSQEQQLQDLAEHEARRREEIATKQAEQLEDLAANEAEKRAQIEASFAEQMAKAEENYQSQMARENERYAEKKAALDEAMQKRLEDIAKELADEKTINEEGARAILEALNKTFGVGGDIDALMEDFAARRRQKMIVKIELENSLSDDSSKGTPGEKGNMGGPNIPGFAEGGIVPGPIGAPILAKLHGGEMVVPFDQLMMNRGGGKRLEVDITMKGSAPPGVRSGERDAIASTLVAALREAGIDAR